MTVVEVEGGTIWSGSVEVTLPRGVAITPPIWMELVGLGAMVLGAILEGAVIFLPEGMLLGEKSCLRAPDPGDRMWSLGPVERGESDGGVGECEVGGRGWRVWYDKSRCIHCNFKCTEASRYTPYYV